MSLTRLGSLCLVATVAVAGWAAAAKVRLDARAHLSEADARLAEAEASGATADLIAAAEAYGRAAASWTPFDQNCGRAAAEARRLAEDLAARGLEQDSRRALAPLRQLDRRALLFQPHPRQEER